MPTSTRSPNNALKTFVSRYPVTAYFIFTFAISWAGALAVAAPRLFRHESLPQVIGVLMFPAMLLGPSLAGIFLTALLDGKAGLQNLFAQMARARFPARWYAALLIPPILIFAVLTCLRIFLSPAYSPSLFWLGLMFGIPAGFLEEIGWTGFAFPHMAAKRNLFASSIILGVLWSTWHLPVMNYLGVATPHGDYGFQFFLAFALAMTAMRVIICWLYTHTKSVLLAQLMHISSTASLVVFGAAHVTAPQEAFWYALYGITLWIIAGSIALQLRKTS